MGWFVPRAGRGLRASGPAGPACAVEGAGPAGLPARRRLTPSAAMKRAAILDIDGTLLFSNDAHAQAFLEAARELGYVTPPVAAVVMQFGMDGYRLVPRALWLVQDQPRRSTFE